MCSSYACTCIQYTCLCLCTYILYIHSIYIHIYVYLFARLFFAAKFDAEYIAAVWLILAIRIDLQPRCLQLSNGLHTLAKHRRKWRWENKQLGLSNNGPIISNNGLSLNFMAIFIEGKWSSTIGSWGFQNYLELGCETKRIIPTLMDVGKRVVCSKWTSTPCFLHVASFQPSVPIGNIY